MLLIIQLEHLSEQFIQEGILRPFLLITCINDAFNITEEDQFIACAGEMSIFLNGSESDCIIVGSNSAKNEKDKLKEIDRRSAEHQRIQTLLGKEPVKEEINCNTAKSWAT